MTAKKLTRGRPRKAERPNSVTLSVRHVDRDRAKALHRYAVDKDLTVGEALTEILRATLP
jgi:hypothetical protein